MPAESAERVNAAVDALLDGRPPRRYPAGADEIEALRGAALLAGTREEVTEARPEFIEALAARLRSSLGGPAGTAPADVSSPEREPEPARVIPLGRTGRRTFLLGAGAAAAAAAAGVLADRLVRDGSGQYSAGQGSSAELQPQNATWHDVAALDAVRTAGPIRFRAGAIEGVLVAATDGGVNAFSAVCTHMGCVLDVASSRDHLDCPCHNASFGLDGMPDAANYIALPRLPWLHSRVVGDRVEVLA